MKTGFLYYIPEYKSFKRTDAVALGLNDRLEAFTTRNTGKGPDGKNGIVVSSEGVECYYREAGQHWQQFGGVWIGFDESNKPKPEDLLRSDSYSSWPVNMGDQRAWNIPVLRVLETGSILPDQQIMILNEDGKFTAAIKKEFLEFGERIGKIWEELAERFQLYADEDNGRFSFTINIEQDSEIICEALSFNYRISREEISLLELLTSDSIQRSFQAMFDLPSANHILKKNSL